MSYTTVHLPHWDGGMRKIRFIYLANTTSFRMTAYPVEVSVRLCFGEIPGRKFNEVKRILLAIHIFSCLVPPQRPMIPLFLGADLLSETDIRSENHSKYHSKFAKKGFATKITFSSGVLSKTLFYLAKFMLFKRRELHLIFFQSAFRFHGLRISAANNSLWFYSIQGLFRVAFEMYSRHEQLTVLENFQVNQYIICTTYTQCVH